MDLARSGNKNLNDKVDGNLLEEPDFVDLNCWKFVQEIRLQKMFD